MYKLLTQKGQLFAIGLGILCVAIAIGSIISGVNSKYSMSEDLNYIMKNQADATFDFFNPAVVVFLGLILIAILIAVAFGIYGLVTNIKGSMKVILGLLGIIVLFTILYVTSDVETAGRLGMLTEKFEVSDTVSKLISAGIKTFMIGFVIAALSAIVMEVLNLFK